MNLSWYRHETSGMFGYSIFREIEIMKDSLMGILNCKECRTPLEATIRAREGERIKEGELICKICNAKYNITNYIPRIAPNDAYLGSFSFEWNRFYDVQMDTYNRNQESELTFRRKTGWREDDLKGKLVLDAGVGAGRFAEVASRWGAEVVGVDLSFAVEAAQKNIGDRDNVNIVQGDIFHLPFREKSFDHIYSIGVLHHTPNTRAAFKALVPFLKNGGELAVYIYVWGQYHYFSDLWRKITTRLPARVVYYFSAIAVPLYYLHKIPLIGKAVHFLLPTAHWPDWRWNWLDTFDWYTPKYQWKHSWPEVFRWFKEEGFQEIELFEEEEGNPMGGICMRGRKK